MLSLIITPGQCASDAYQMTKRDITPEEAVDLIRKAAAGYNDTLKETVCCSSSLHILGVAYCKKDTPVSLVIQDGAVTKKYRGPIVVCGPADSRDLAPDFAADVAVEPRYKDDVVCIPSFAEWIAIPEKKRKAIAAGNWNWSRDLVQIGTDTTKSHILFPDGRDDVFYGVGDQDGGVAPVFDLTKLPADVADKIRNAEPDERGVVEFDRIELIKLTDNTYVGKTPFHDPRRDVRNYQELQDDSRCDSYEVCELRRELNGPYLETFIEYIRNTEKEDN